jgi:hypothetical protein
MITEKLAAEIAERDYLRITGGAVLPDVVKLAITAIYKTFYLMQESPEKSNLRQRIHVLEYAAEGLPIDYISGKEGIAEWTPQLKSAYKLGETVYLAGANK